MVRPVPRSCRARPLLHPDHQHGHPDVWGPEDDADDRDRSFPAANDDAHALDVHGHVFSHSGFQWFGSLYCHAKYYGDHPAVAPQSNVAAESSFCKEQKTDDTRGADEVSSAVGCFGEPAMPASVVREGKLDREAAAAEIRRYLDTILRTGRFHLS